VNNSLSSEFSSLLLTIFDAIVVADVVAVDEDDENEDVE